MNDSEEVAQFARQLITIQRQLFVYITQLVGRSDADDVLQEVNRVAWEKYHEFAPGTNLTAWAYKIAYFEILRFRKTKGREKLRFKEATLDLLASDAAGRADQEPIRQAALRECLAKLPAADRDLVSGRYLDGVEVRALAAKLGQSEKAIYRALVRIRTILLECVRRTLAEAWR
jgi:RNA polymerase sigma-70 factor (ECF subfamily)